MAMSSYLINSNYVDPKFPPCEEYSQSDYLPSHSPDYYSSQRQEPNAFQPDSLYHHQQQQQHRADPPFMPCQRAAQPASVVISPRGHVALPAPVSEQSHRCDSVTPSPPPPPPPPPLSCVQGASSPGSARKDPPVVYPWMKKVHVNIGKSCMEKLSPPPPIRALLPSFVSRVGPPSERAAPCARSAAGGEELALGSRFTVVCLQGQYNYTLHNFLLHLSAAESFEV